MSLGTKVKLRFFLIIGFLFLITILIILYLPEKSELVNSEDKVDGTKTLESLQGLPYVTWANISEKDAGKVGVTEYKPKKSYRGVNLYYTENKPGGYFFDMFGKVLHRFVDKREHAANWQIIEPYSDDNFLVISQLKFLFMIDRDSNIEWELKGTFHHDIAVAENGDIYTLIHKKMNIPKISPKEPVRDDLLVIFSKDGKIKKVVSLIAMLLKDKQLLAAAMAHEEKRYDFGKDAWDIFHTNSIEIINRDINFEGKRLFKKCNIFL